jgi:hypothetical protein
LVDRTWAVRGPNLSQFCEPGVQGSPWPAMIASVALPYSELSSLASALEELTSRVSEIAKQASDDADEASTELFAAERALRSAQRRIAKLSVTASRG